MFLLVALVCSFHLSSASICCAPPQWEGGSSFVTAFIHNGKASTVKGRISMAFDAVNNRVGTYEEIAIPGREGKKFGVLLDYGSNTKYMAEIENEQVTKCMKSVLNRPAGLLRCVPDDAYPLYENAAMGSMNINAYSVNASNIQFHIGVTASSCVPVFEVIRGNVDGNGFIQNNFYFNVTGGISDPNTLRSPPLGCENAQMVSAHYASDNFNPSIIGKRSFFI